jgi:hypothetical protein
MTVAKMALRAATCFHLSVGRRDAIPIPANASIESVTLATKMFRKGGSLGVLAAQSSQRPVKDRSYPRRFLLERFRHAFALQGRAALGRCARGF